METSLSTRILILAPTKKDADVSRSLLKKAGLTGVVCYGIEALSAEIEKGAGAALVTEDVLSAGKIEQFLAALRRQPSWSELPIIILMKENGDSSEMAQTLRLMGNVTILERPASIRSVISAVKAALRGRMRQYQIRDLIMTERASRIEAEVAGRMKDEFLAMLSHELRTPLNAILGWLQLLRREKAVSTRISEGLSVIERSAGLQAKLIADLLDMSRITSGKLHLDFVPTELRSVIDAAVESINPAAREKHISIVKENITDALVLGDFGRLQQIFWNLLSNSIKFTPEHGKVVIESNISESEIEVSVKDYGVGIKEEFLPYVFDRFRQADASAARRYGGLGLGLAIVKQLTQLHHGRVEVQSPGEGKGATFTVILPRLVLEKQLTSESGRFPDVSSQEPNRALENLKILVVDDDLDSRELVKHLLSQWGAEVEVLESAKLALELLKYKKFDIIISDIGMPEVDGYDFMKTVRSLKSSASKTPATALTAFARTEERRKAIDAGYDSYMTKPIEELNFVSEVARLTGRELRMVHSASSQIH